MSIMDNVFSFFVEEAKEHLSVLEEGLLELEKNPSAGDSVIEPLFRAAHTLKGSANLVNVTDVGAIAHRLEDILEEIRDGQALPTKPRINAMLFALDQIRELVELRKLGEKDTEDLVAVALSRLAEADNLDLAAGLNAAGPPRESDAERALAADELLYAGRERRETGRRVDEAGAVRVGMQQIEALMGLVGELTIAKNHLLNRVPELDRMRGEVDFAGKRLLQEVTGFADRYDYNLPQQSPSAEGGDFRDLEFDRYDDLNLFSRKLREITHDIDEALDQINGFFNGFSRDVQALDRMSEEIKERISIARTVPASQLFQRFNRPIRDLAQENNRLVELCVAGGETAIDRVIYDGLFDPLLHIIRNVFAHGIEPAAERLKKGKAPKANVWLKAERRGNTVEISVEDDGRGIDLQRVRQRAIDKGFIAADEQLSDQELVQLIFRPGFSTTLAADAESGRGVGMSVVMDRLASLNGTIDVWTEPDLGTSFKLRLPMSLVIVNVIQFACRGTVFVIPSALVDEIVDLDYESKREPQETERASISRIDLAALFNLPPQAAAPAIGIVTQSEGAPVMLLADGVLGQEDTVIKPFGSFLQELQYFSGSSISGDGTLRLVVNPARMKYARFDQLPAATAPQPADKEKKVLVVDDSLSVRKYASLLLSHQGFSVLSAANGQEALELLAQEAIFSVITDLEMPVMHGYDLLRELRRRGSAVPVAVLTSRAGEQHRQEALALGATDYLVKPFDEEALIAVVRAHESV